LQKKKARRLFLAAALVSPLVVSACATTPNPDVDAFARHSGRNSFEVSQRAASPEALVLPLVQDRQTQGPSCGIHALASIVNYWRGPGTLTGSAYYKAHPPAHKAGYSMDELLVIAREQGLLSQAVRMPSFAAVRFWCRSRCHPSTSSSAFCPAAICPSSVPCDAS
jgi:hypothetical protein